MASLLKNFNVRNSFKLMRFGRLENWRAHAHVQTKTFRTCAQRAKDIDRCMYTDLLPWNKRGQKETAEFLDRITKLLITHVEKTNDRKEKVIEFKHPEELLKVIDLSLPDQGMPIGSLLKDCETALKYQVKTGHPNFYNQLSQGLDTVGMAGEWLIATANANMFTYEIAPVFILMEAYVLKKMREIIGYPNGDSIFAPGGTICNLYAILVARHKMFPDYKNKGLWSCPKDLTVFTSEHCHYSVKSACMVAGLGMNNCVAIKTDEKTGKMLPSELEKAIKAAKSSNRVPFLVNCTTGTTVFGAFDPINDLADICKKHNLWLHLDGAWGGSLIMSEKYRAPRFDGCERADSMTWNPHKLLTTPLQCSTIHFKEDGLLTSCNSMCADYLFQKDKFYDLKYDTGDKVIQCGRHNDVFKFWLQWRAKGTKGLGAHIDHLMGLNEYFMDLMRKRPDTFIIIVDKPECVNACFWYVPKRYRKEPKTPQVYQKLGPIQAKMKELMVRKGSLMVGYQPQGNTPNFFRNIISNPACTKEDIEFLVNELDTLGRDL